MDSRIAYLRKQRGLSLRDVAHGAGTTPAQIQKLERGERRLTLEWMQRLARALGVEIADLLPTSDRSPDGPEREIVNIIASLPKREQTALVRVARELLGTVRRLERSEPNPPRTRAK
jgi:transcriptional regulator with XRE-family HTH domain